MKLDCQLQRLIQMVDVSLPQLYERVKDETSYPDEAKVSDDDAVDRAELIALALVILSDLG